MIVHPDGATVSFTYDERNNLATSTDENGVTTSFAYDEFNDVTRVTDGLGNITTYTYEPGFNKVSNVTDPLGRTQSFTYDNRGNVIGVTYADGSMKSMSYDERGLLVTATDENGNAIQLAYDKYGHLATVTNPDGTVKDIRSDLLGRVVAVTRYQYDRISQLIAVDYPQREWEPELTVEEKTNGTTKGKGEKNGHFKNRCDITLDCLPSMVSYSYDGAGNRLTMSDDWQTTSYSYNAANQMVQAGTAIFSYDANGNRIQKSDNGETANYSYTYDDLLAQVDGPNGAMTGYGYDAFNRRIYTTDQDGNTTAYLYDGLDVLQEVTGQNDQKIATYYRVNGTILTRQEFNVSQYDAYGQLTGGDIKENTYTFTGKRFDEESGLYHFHFRKYDPVVGVWTTEDLIGMMGGNVYGYMAWGQVLNCIGNQMHICHVACNMVIS